MKVRYRHLKFLGYSRYRIGSDGSVWFRRTKLCPTCQAHVLVWKKKKTQLISGYESTLLSAGGKYKLFSIHRLVLEAFIGSCPDGMECRHLNGVRTDNNVDNLAWGTPRENAADRESHGNTARGERASKSKLLPPQVLWARKQCQRYGRSYAEVARELGVTPTAVRMLVLRKSWSHI